MIKVAIVEDERENQLKLAKYLKQYEKETGAEIGLQCFSCGEEILAQYQGDFDIICMDILMDKINGMETAKQIREKDDTVIFIFITSTVAYAIQGYEVDAIGYIVKPVPYEAFAQVINKAAAQLNERQKNFLVIKNDKKVLRIDCSIIYYIESQLHNVVIHTTKGVYVEAGTMKVLEEELKGKGFSRCNQPYLVNLKYVDSVIGNNVIVNGEELSISRAKKKAFLSELTDYIGGGMRTGL